AQPPHFLALSAKSAAALGALVDSVAAHLSANPNLAIADVCFTANTGRAHFPYRLGVIAASTAELCRKLHAYRDGHQVEGVLVGQPSDGSDTVLEGQATIPYLELATLGRAYASGDSIDWRALYQQAHCRKVTLPTYPFQRERYWVETVPPQLEAATSLLGQRVH